MATRKNAKGPIPRRALGSTGVEVSMVGLGGYHIGGIRTEREAIRVVHAALDAGIDFLDNSWDYHGGRSEKRLGRALTGGRRDRAFLMTKIDGRTKREATRQINESLKRLRTDHLDLVQHHEVIRMEDGDRVFARGGAHEAMLAARKAGKLRFIGFTGHKDPLVHLRMLEVAVENGFRFDTVQMPLNAFDASFRSFGKLVLPVLVDQGIGVLGMKSMGAGALLETGVVTPEECLRYALTLPTSVVIVGVDSMRVLSETLETARAFRPMNETQMAALVRRCAPYAARGQSEPFKTTPQHDSTAKHPEWLG